MEEELMCIIAVYMGLLKLDEAATIIPLLNARNPPERYLGLPRLHVESLHPQECWDMFRFSKEDIPRLQRALRIPDEVRCRNHVVENGITALCVLLRPLAYPNRWVDLCNIFGRCPSDLCIIFYHVLDHIYENFCHLLLIIDQLFWLTPDHLAVYCTAVENKGSPLSNVWGFIDVTARPMCRPTNFQQVTFSGHKRYHCLKYQSIIVPNGLIANLFGPVEGRRHDAMMLRMSGILGTLERNMNLNGRPLSWYGDSAYPLRPHLICPFRGAVLTDEKRQFNNRMSMVRQCVEWGFKDVIVNFAFVNYRNNHKVHQQPLAKFYFVATLLVNCKSCLHGNQTSEFFRLAPPRFGKLLE